MPPRSVHSSRRRPSPFQLRPGRIQAYLDAVDDTATVAVSSNRDVVCSECLASGVENAKIKARDSPLGNAYGPRSTVARPSQVRGDSPADVREASCKTRTSSTNGRRSLKRLPVCKRGRALPSFSLASPRLKTADRGIPREPQKRSPCRRDHANRVEIPGPRIGSPAS
jgi:hypothetical protein